MEKTELISFRERYEKETGMVSHQYGGVPREEYVTWLERENAKLKAQLTWRLVSEKPEKGKEVILSYVDCYGHRINVLGSYVRRFDEEAGSADDEDIMEYSDEKDEYYLKEGWYEHTTHSDYDCWLLHEKIDKWLPIPPAPEGEFMISVSENRADKVKQIGNAVSPKIAEALAGGQ